MAIKPWNDANGDGKPDSTLSMSEINAEFNLGNVLSSYRGVTWYLADGSTGTFPYSNLSMSLFYGKSAKPAFQYSVLTTSGTYQVPSFANRVDIIYVGGGGSGGSDNMYWGLGADGGGGGGGGGVVTYTGVVVVPNSVYNYIIGAGGAAAVNSQGNCGNDTTIGSLPAAKGGGGGGSSPYSAAGAGNPLTGYDSNGNPTYQYRIHDGLPGGSGGGANAYHGANAYWNGQPGPGTSGQGNAGGTQADNGFNGGGGGAGGPGYCTADTVQYSGGAGIQYYLRYVGLPLALGAGGGAGGSFTSGPNVGGNEHRFAYPGHGGGDGGIGEWGAVNYYGIPYNAANASGKPGLANRGGGGGGNGGAYRGGAGGLGSGGNGGSGVIHIVAYQA